jgi:hypothetical protein
MSRPEPVQSEICDVALHPLGETRKPETGLPVPVCPVLAVKNSITRRAVPASGAKKPEWEGLAGLSLESGRVASLGLPPGISCEQRGEIFRGDDPRGFVAAEGQEAALVARHEVIGLAAFGRGQ